MLTAQEAAARVRLTQWAIYRAIQRGELTAYKPGGRLRIRSEDLRRRSLQGVKTLVHHAAAR
jgi:excisionase family DNA binding protein